ncbi:hypothetical protein E8E14_000187 [Neopestalotiopsis sp. 37M]|nr:hypothetical protein E8E14_000187 [Neopestalotiopsis sp. 37M]
MNVEFCLVVFSFSLSSFAPSNGTANAEQQNSSSDGESGIPSVMPWALCGGNPPANARDGADCVIPQLELVTANGEPLRSAAATGGGCRSALRLPVCRYTAPENLT